MSSHDLRTSSRRPSNTTGRTDTSHSPPSTSPSGSHHSFPRSPSNQFPTHRRTDSRRPAIALPSPQQQSAADAEGIGALPPSSGEPPAKKGHRRGASWTAKFGSGNWKSLAGFGGSTDKEDLRRDRLNSSATRGANSGKMMSLEFDRFLDERFKADEYIQSTLHSNNEEGVRQFYTLLNDAKESAAQDLQRNVFKNYNEFVVISKEISKLETDMLYLRGLLTELKSVHDGQTSDPIDSNEQSFKGPMQVRTNSVDAEDGMKKAQINLLWETVEGAQKLLPPSTSHVFLRESPSFHEVDPKNPQLKQPVHLYLLNTCLLVASKKKRGFSFIGGMGMRGVPDFGSSKKLVAEKCWNLSEIAVIDVKDTYDITNAFKIMKHPHQYMYRCDSLQEKKSWVSHLKKAIDEYVAENRAENDVGEMATSFSPTTVSPDTIDVFGKPRRPSNTPRSKTKDLTPADIKWLMDLLDDLDVFIAHREFDEAVDAVTKAKALLSSLPSETQRTMQFRRQLDIRVQKLSKVISIDLANPQLNKSSVKMNINRLLKLELHDQARTIFLNARSAIIKQRVRQLKFEGEISSYISELAFVVFTLIKNSCDWYNSSFREPGMASGFVKWAKSELENYVMIFKRQVFDNQQRFQVIADCIRTTDDQLSSLKEVGLDLTFLFSQLIQSNIVDAIQSYEQRCAEVIAKSVAEDTYVPMKQPGDGSGIRTDSQAERERESLGTTLPITKCMVKFYQTMVEFLSDTSTLLSPSLYTTSIGSICSLFDAYLNWELQVVNEKDLKEEQLFPVLYNSIYTIQDFLPQIASRLSRHFERPIPELDSLRQRLQPTLEAIEQAVAKKRVRVITGSIYNFNNINLESNEPIKNDANPSTAMQKLISTINKVGSEIDPSAEPKRVMEFMIESVFRFLNDASNWETSSGPRKFGSEGVSQLVLDIHFFQKVCTDFMTEFSCDSAQDVCEKSLKMLLTQNPKAAASLKSGDWYERRVDSAIKSLGSEYQSFGKNIVRTRSKSVSRDIPKLDTSAKPPQHSKPTPTVVMPKSASRERFNSGYSISDRSDDRREDRKDNSPVQAMPKSSSRDRFVGGNLGPDRIEERREEKKDVSAVSSMPKSSSRERFNTEATVPERREDRKDISSEQAIPKSGSRELINGGGLRVDRIEERKDDRNVTSPNQALPKSTSRERISGASLGIDRIEDRQTPVPKSPSRERISGNRNLGASYNDGSRKQSSGSIVSPTGSATTRELPSVSVEPPRQRLESESDLRSRAVSTGAVLSAASSRNDIRSTGSTPSLSTREAKTEEVTSSASSTWNSSTSSVRDRIKSMNSSQQNQSTTSVSSKNVSDRPREIPESRDRAEKSPTVLEGERPRRNSERDREQQSKAASPAPQINRSNSNRGQSLAEKLEKLERTMNRDGRSSPRDTASGSGSPRSSRRAVTDDNKVAGSSGKDDDKERSERIKDRIARLERTLNDTRK